MKSSLCLGLDLPENLTALLLSVESYNHSFLTWSWTIKIRLGKWKEVESSNVRILRCWYKWKITSPVTAGGETKWQHLELSLVRAPMKGLPGWTPSPSGLVSLRPLKVSRCRPLRSLRVRSFPTDISIYTHTLCVLSNGTSLFSFLIFPN